MIHSFDTPSISIMHQLTRVFNHFYNPLVGFQGVLNMFYVSSVKRLAFLALHLLLVLRLAFFHSPSSYCSESCSSSCLISPGSSLSSCYNGTLLDLWRGLSSNTWDAQQETPSMSVKKQNQNTVHINCWFIIYH